MTQQIENSTDVDWKTGDGEYYQFLQDAYDIDKAKGFLAETPHEVGYIEVEKFKSLISLPEDGISLITTHVDWDRIRETDEINLDIPVIFGWTVERDDHESRPFLIDGHHRLAKAIDDGTEQILAVLLTKEESDECYENLIPWHKRAGFERVKGT